MKLRISVFLCIWGVYCLPLRADEPIDNRYDSHYLHSTLGYMQFSHFLEKKEKAWGRVYISPFHQHSSGARSKTSKRTTDTEICKSKKTYEGNIDGRVNMLGVYLGTDAAPTNTPIVRDPTTDFIVPPQDPSYLKNYFSIYKQIREDASANPPNISLSTQEKYLTNTEFVKYENDSLNQTGFYDIPIDYQRIGLRVGAVFCPCSYLMLQAKIGFSEYYQSPCFFTITRDTTASPEEQAMDGVVVNDLMNQTQRDKISCDLGIDFGYQSKTALEDSIVKLSLLGDFPFFDEGEVDTMHLSPCLSLGVLVPSGTKKDINAYFELPFGSDGYTGFISEGHLSMYIVGAVHFSFGVAATYYFSRTIEARVPSSPYQVGIYPWKTTIKRKPGVTWKAYISMQAHLFWEGFCFVFDYVYAKHEHDSIILKECNPTRKAAFLPCKLEKESVWRNQTYFFGLNYELTPNFTFGFGYQGKLSGVRVYRTQTLMGTLAFQF